MFVDDAYAKAEYQHQPVPPSPEVIAEENARLAAERRLVVAAGQLNAAFAHLVDATAEVLASGAWQGHGIRSAAHWLSWQASISSARARGVVRVAERITDLPQTAAALRAGELSESAAVAIARVGTPENEGELLHLARYGTITQLENTCATYQKVLTLAEQEREQKPPRLQHFVRWHFDDRDGALVLRARMDGDDGSVLVKALEAASRDLAARADDEEDETSADADGSGAEGRSSHGAAGGEGAAGPADEADDHDETDLARCRKAEPYHEEPYSPLAEALAELARKSLDARNGGRRLADHHQVILHISLKDLLAGTITDDGAYLLDGAALSIEVARRLTCDSSVRLLLEHEGEPLDIGRRSQTVPDPMRRALERRDRGRCRYYGCGQRHRLHAHHVIHWAKGGPTALWNLILLCPMHHKLVHEGGFDCRHTPDGVRFYRPNKTEVVGRPDPPGQRGDPPPLPLPEGIDHTTAACRWDGSRLHLGDAIQMLLAADGRLTD